MVWQKLALKILHVFFTVGRVRWGFGNFLIMIWVNSDVPRQMVVAEPSKMQHQVRSVTQYPRNLLLGTCPKAYRPTKRRINSLWPIGKVLYSRHNMIGIEYRICCGLAGLAFMCNNPFLFVFLFPWGQGWIWDVFPHLSGEGCSILC